MKKLVILLLILAIMTLGCIGKSTNDTQTTDNVQTNDIVDSSWCSPDLFPTNGSEGFTLKGITEHNGSEVCEAEWKYSSGTATEYFTRDGIATMEYSSSLNNGSDEIPSTVDENITNDSNDSLINVTVGNSS